MADFDWEADIGQVRNAEDTSVAGTGAKYKAIEKDVEEFINDLNPSQRQHAFDPNDWYDWSVAVSKMPYSQMRQDKRFRALAIRTFHFRDKKVDVSGIDYDPTDADELFDESHIVKERFSLPYKGDKKQQLKSRLAAIGVNFPNDNEPTPRLIQRKQRENVIKKTRKSIPLEKAGFGKPYMDRLTSESKYLDKGIKVRPPKPTNNEFGNIISAAREHVKEAKIDFDHNHSIEWRVINKGKQRTAYLIDTQTNRRFTKYWLLNAKQVNGNGWGVDPSTIDENIQKFVGKPFVVTAQSWIPDSEYGNSFVHPYIPTNNLRRIFQHQAKYTVGIVRRIIRDEKDDYYAMIEKLPKFAHMRDPPFCSPGIFQMDRNEPMDKIRTWEPLHLAGLEEDPAYGAHVALLKGNCVGTENECYVQFRGAQLEVVTQCPIRKARKTKLKERLEGVVLEASANKVVEAFKKKEPLKSGNHSTDGKAYYIFGNKIAEHSPQGLRVTNAGYDTPTTYNSLKRLGVSAEVKGGQIHINNQPYKHGTFVTVPYNDLKPQEELISSSGQSSTNRDPNEVIQKLRGLRRDVMEKHKGLSATSIQPEDQKTINKITGVKSKIPKPTRATAAHHILYRRNVPGMQFNPNNLIPVDRASHSEAHRFDKMKVFGKLVRVAGIKDEQMGEEEPNFGDYMLDSTGSYYGPLADDHSGYIADYYSDDAFDEGEKEDMLNNMDMEPEEAYEKYFTETGDIRVIHENGYTNHIMYKKPTPEQMKAMQETEKEFPDHIHSFQLVTPGRQHVEQHNNFNDFKLHLHGEQTEEDTARHNLLKQFHQGKLVDTEETPKVNINPSHGKVIANAYEKMTHAPNNAYVKTAYGALINETKQQYKDLLDKGLKIDRITGDNPYRNSKDMHKDLEENNHLHYFPTESGFGQGEENKDHPMMQPTEFKDKEHTLLANDVFRIVHDINGHHRGGKTGFGPTGEHQAYMTHKKMFTPLANKALFTETAAQNNYVNFGPNGEHNRTDPKNTIYAQQKAGIMPAHIIHGRFHNV